MKIKFILLFLSLSQVVFSQEKNEIEKLKKYSGYIHIIEPKIKYWSYKYKLENGKISQQENYFKKELRYKCKFLYDTLNNITREIKIHNGIKQINDTMVKKEFFNDKGQLIEVIADNEFNKKYRNHNKQGYPKLVEFDDGIYKDMKTEYKYDSLNNIIEEKTSFKFLHNDSIYKFKHPIPEDKSIIEIITYKYDKFNNVIELNRSFNYEVEFPIHYFGGRSHFESEKFRYVYNKNGLWIKKYWIVEGKEYYIEKRKFYK